MKNIGININTSKDLEGEILKHTIDTIYRIIPDSKIEIYKDAKGLNEAKTKELDFIISLGGDGTILGAARELVNFETPILGVNIGHLGFLTEVECSEFEYAIRSVNEGHFCIEDRMMLECFVEDESGPKKFNALNDIVLSKGTLSRMAAFDIEIDNKFYTNFTADGVIVSTPTGSTAYSLSAGGPIIYPTLSLISITPICPHTLGFRTTIFDSNSTVHINIKQNYESLFLTVDGQESLELKKINRIEIKASNSKCRLIKLKNYSYFNILRKKITSRTKECEGGK